MLWITTLLFAFCLFVSEIKKGRKMHNEIAIERYGYNNTNTVEEKTKELKRIGNDSLFYFGIFLTAFFLLHAIPFATGLFEQINIGINEVVVSAVGFANVFFLGVFNKIFKSNK